MHAIESDWLERTRSCRLCMLTASIWHRLHLRCAGWILVHNGTIAPLLGRAFGRPASRCTLRANIELRIVPNLWPIIDAIVASGLEFSIIRKLNAMPRVASTSAA